MLPMTVRLPSPYTPPMTARSIAVIATRLIGLVLLIYGAAQLLGQVLPFIQFMNWISWKWSIVIENLSGSERFGFSINTIGLAIVSAALGWYLLFRGRRVHAWLLAGLGADCPKCGYNLRGITAANCPECGGSVRQITDQPRA
jgi:hypothetical protein